MVASFSRLATMKIIPIIALGFITIIFLNSLQRYGVLLIPPNFWDNLRGNVMNGRNSERKKATNGRKKAKQSSWRISEATFLILAVIGGSIGALLGMKS